MSSARRSRVLLAAFAAFAAALFGGAARAEQWVFELDPEATEIRFLLDATMHKVRGTAELASGEIGFDGETGAARGEVVVGAASLATGNAKRDRDMHEKVLESERFPEIVLAVDGFTGDFDPASPSTITVDARMSIHGGEHPLRLEMRLAPRDGGRLAAATTFAVPYVEWGMENPSRFLLKVGKEVEVTIEAEGVLTR